MGIVDRIREESKRSGKGKEKFFYIRSGEKKRIRFLQSIEGGVEIPFHDTKGNVRDKLNVPCQTIFGRSCPYCGDEDIRLRSLFAWSVYNYEDKEVQIFMQAANQFTAVPSLVNLEEVNGDLTEYDVVIIRSGNGLDTSYTVIPQQNCKFRNEKAKPLSKKAILKYLDQAYPCDDNNYDSSSSKDFMNAPENEDEEEDGYSGMTAKKLYALCKERDIEVPIKKSESFYIRKLKEWDKQQEDWGEDEENSDEWEEDLPFN